MMMTIIFLWMGPVTMEFVMFPQASGFIIEGGEAASCLLWAAVHNEA